MIGTSISHSIRVWDASLEPVLIGPFGGWRPGPLLPTTAVFTLLAILGVLYLASWLLDRHSGTDSVDLAVTDDESTAPAPGEEINRRLKRPSGRMDAQSLLREQLAKRLVHIHGHSEERAKQMIASGAWTTDPLAGAYLGRGAPKLGLTRRLRLRLRGVDPAVWLFELTVQTIEEGEIEGARGDD